MPSEKLNAGEPDLDRSSIPLARRTLLVGLSLAWVGAAVGVIGMRAGTVVGLEAALIWCSLSFSASGLVTMLYFRRVGLQTVATVATAFFAFNLCSGMGIAVFGSGNHLSIFVYLFWFFPLLVFNRMVNKPSVGRTLVKVLVAVPVLFIVCAASRLTAIFDAQPLIILGVYCVCYFTFAIMLGSVTRYREEYLVERERLKSMKLESELLESISDCFLSLDSSSRLVYLNDAACTELSLKRETALNRPLWDVAPGPFSKSMLAGMIAASDSAVDNVFEVENEGRSEWYSMRCYPGPGRWSVYFRNVTDAMSARLELEKAHEALREKSALLDHAHDAIFVLNMDFRFSYWNKGAERLYGWKADEVMGRTAADIFHYDLALLNGRSKAILRDGEWTGEIVQRHSSGKNLTVESHVTLVTRDDGKPHSLLAIDTDITDRKAAAARIEQLAFYDTLTELPNRQLLRERIRAAVTRSTRVATMGALLNIDIDNFKTLNATRGLHGGDSLLTQAAVRLRSCTGSADTVARIGGDEFAVLLEGLSGDSGSAAQQAVSAGGRILEALRQPYLLGQNEVVISAGIGIALFPEGIDTPEELLKRANIAMYGAKAQGRNRLCFFDPAMQTQLMSRSALSSDLGRALTNREFELHYQPQVGRDGRVTGAEALLRWRHPRRGMVPPSEFIPLAEEGGLILEIGEWVLNTACSQLAKWATRPELRHLNLAVNVSVRQFLDSNIVNLVRQALHSTGADPRRLKLEITESSVMEKVEDVIAKMGSINALGVVFSLDDFGTGYSSLSHLRRLPLTQLKIDRSFVRDVLANPKDASIARTIITLGSNLNLSVIAEGVETEDQRMFLDREGCHAYQGFLFSPALAVARFEEFVKSA